MALPSYDKRPATPASAKAMQENNGPTEVPSLRPGEEGDESEP